jgi:hypothetical protein
MRIFTCSQLAHYCGVKPWKIARMTLNGYIRADVADANGSGSRRLYSLREAKRAKAWFASYRRYMRLRKQLGLRIGCEER